MLENIAGGRIFYNRGAFETAENILRNAFKQARSENKLFLAALALHALAFTLIDSGKKQEAFRLCENFIEEALLAVPSDDPKAALVQLPITVIYAQGGRLEKAAESYKHLLEDYSFSLVNPLFIENVLTVRYSLEEVLRLADDEFTVMEDSTCMVPEQNPSFHHLNRQAIEAAGQWKAGASDRWMGWVVCIDKRREEDHVLYSAQPLEIIVYAKLLLKLNLIDEAGDFLLRLLNETEGRIGLRQEIKCRLLHCKNL